jgi:ribosome-associated protein
MTDTDSLAFAAQVIEWGLSKKAENPVLLDLRELFDVTDCFVVLTGSSELQVRAIVDAILDGAREQTEKPNHVEGTERARWVLIDFVHVVVHVMLPEVRMRYGLERLWGDAPMTRFDELGQPVAEGETA